MPGKAGRWCGKGPLPDHRHELYCQLRHKGMTITEAGTGAGFAYNTARKGSLETNPEIVARLAQLAETMLKDTNITLEKVLGDIEEAREGAMGAEQYGAAIRASELHGKYLKIFTDRVEHMHTITDITQEKLDSVINELLETLDATDGRTVKGDGPETGALSRLDGEEGENGKAGARDAIPGDGTAET